MWSVECGVRSVERGAWGVECGAWSVGPGVCIVNYIQLDSKSQRIIRTDKSISPHFVAIHGIMDFTYMTL